MPGVTIGDNVIIGAGSVVSKISRTIQLRQVTLQLLLVLHLIILRGTETIWSIVQYLTKDGHLDQVLLNRISKS
ncbi:MAG: hypothetical protein RJR34_11290 [Candidatus Methanoculleus thermohydrogenotrophicum]|nr:hypothetical protein [Candidatus Methanoculleus thermohydrogenotrophicum]